MLELIIAISTAVLSVSALILVYKCKKEMNLVWNRVAVNDIHIQKLQDQLGIEKEPESSRMKVKPLKERLKKD